MTQEEHINYWLTIAEHDIPIIKTLFDNGHYDWCLFICHLVLEKMLKAHFVKNLNETPPKIHDLLILAKRSNLNLNEEQLIFLQYANYFNLSARYPEEKLKLYQTCTKEYTEEQLTKFEEVYLWLKSNLK